MFDWLLPKAAPDIVLWSDEGKLYYGYWYKHPAGKTVVHVPKLAGDYVLCEADGIVKRFNGTPHSWIVGWKKYA